MTEPTGPTVEERLSAVEASVPTLNERMGAVEAAQADTTEAADDAVQKAGQALTAVGNLSGLPESVSTLSARVTALEPTTPTPPTAPTGLQPPTGFKYLVNYATRVATTSWDAVLPGESVEVHEFEIDPANTFKATVAAGTNQRVSGTLNGGRNYTYALRRVRPGDPTSPSAFTDKITQYIPAAGESYTPTAPTTTPPAGGTTGKFPTDIIPELKRWTIMGDTGAQGDPDNDFIIGRAIPEKFYVQSDGGVVFNVDPAGVHSATSKFPRWEARFQNAIANTWNPKSAWASNQAGGHSLEVVLSMDTSKLSARKRGNGIQIHDGSDDVCQIMKHETLGLGFMHDDGKSWVSIDPNYVDGVKFKCKIEVVPGVSGSTTDTINVYYNGVKKVTVPKRGTGWYWKVGAYIQTGGASEYKEPSTARYKVVVYSIVPTGAY